MDSPKQIRPSKRPLRVDESVETKKSVVDGDSQPQLAVRRERRTKRVASTSASPKRETESKTSAPSVFVLMPVGLPGMGQEALVMAQLEQTFEGTGSLTVLSDNEIKDA